MTASLLEMSDKTINKIQSILQSKEAKHIRYERNRWVSYDFQKK